MDLLIPGLVAVAVFIYLGRALPNRALYDSKGAGFDEPDATPRSSLAATRLSRWGAVAILLGLVIRYSERY